jgi:CRISPR-associated protein Cas10/Cmr2 subtype III-B
MPNHDETTFWKRKLAAFLHDPPSKCINLGEHEDWSAKAMSAAGLVSTDYPRLPDWEASAADRIPFPKSRPAAVSSAFDGHRAGFHHPLGGERAPNGGAKACVLSFEKELSGLDQLEGDDSHVQPVLDTSALRGWSESDIDRARYFAHWRLWRKWACEKDWRFNFLPADTRLPDHTIWHHMQVTSALAGCAVSDDPAVPLRPAFLKLQIGPVQDFIAAARSIRDLWSGSYLLSWLMAAGLKKLSELAGPDAVLFPSLWAQPLFDLHWRDSLWSQVSLSDHPKAKKCWDAIKPADSALLTPNLPNVFLALLPADRAEQLAIETERAIRDEFETICAAVWNQCEAGGLCADEPMISAEERWKRFNLQISQFLSISWQVTPWPEDLDAALDLSPPARKDERLAMPAAKARERIEIVREAAEKFLPQEHRDSRYYHNSGRPDYRISEPVRLRSRGLAWSVLLAHNAWELDGVRQLRAFQGRSGAWTPGTANNKDSLTGKDETVAGGSAWRERVPDEWKHLFKYDGDWIGAVTLVKRLWHLAYLKEKWDLPTRSREFSMPNLHSLAADNPFGNDEADEPDAGEKYFAVLAFDGDEIGKWVSGENTPPFASQLADYMDGSGRQRQGMLEYFQRDARYSAFLKTNRPLSPSYHLQFSEALGNFAIHCAAAVVEGHNGRLIYCGGDDVVALLPAHAALECAQDLNRAFTGESPARSVKPRLNGTDITEEDILAQKSSGFLTSKLLCADGTIPIPFTVPGPAASASVGIAVAHFKTPLQEVVREAQKAEKRAKNILGRSAVAVSLFKRSGEITEWGCRWDSGGLELYKAIAAGMDSGTLSTKFPHRVCQLLQPYLTRRTALSKEDDAAGFDASDIIRHEFAFALSRQSASGQERGNDERFRPLLDEYLDRLVKRQSQQDTLNQFLLTSVIGLCTAVAFAHRTKSQSETAEPKGK